MGRIKTQLVKRLTEQLHREHGQELKATFEENKQIVEKLFDRPVSKKLRNVIAGYATRLVKEAQKRAEKEKLSFEKPQAQENLAQ